MDDVTIEAIKFNHDPSSADVDALTIRKNEHGEIKLPEWEAGVSSSPAAYVCAPRKGLSIAIQLRRFNQNVQSVVVNGTSEGILGNAVTAQVYFNQGKVSDFVIIHPIKVRLSEVGVGKWKVVWEWTLTPDAGARNTLQTEHDIYTLFGPPGPPWGPDPMDPKYEHEPPWVDVLEKACEWAAGAHDSVTAATQITTELNNLGSFEPPRLRFDQKRSFSHLKLSGTEQFVFSDFLNRLYAGATTIVNCTDCAMLVTSFANILGCNLFQSRMGGSRFFTNPIRLVGFAKPWPVEFDFHEVAWEYPCESNNNLYDCCLHLDGDPNPSISKNFEPLLPANIPFGDHKGKDYHFRLVQKGQNCVALSRTKKRPKLARDRFSLHRIHAQLKDELKNRFDFVSWEKNFPPPDAKFSEPLDTFRRGFSLSEILLSTGWRCERLRVLAGESEVRELSESIWQLTQDAETELRALCYLCASVEVARDFLLSLLGEFEFPLMRLLDARAASATFGDLAFTSPENEVALFARANIVVFLQNTGSNSISLSSLALSLDSGILNALR